MVSNTPVGTGFVQVAGGGFHSLALRSDGSIASWGWDGYGYGQVSNTPVGPGFTQVAGGRLHSLALRSDGSIVSWGYDSNGQVTNTPGGTGFTQVAGGGDHSLALRSDGSIAAWGLNQTGQVSSTPIGPGFTQVAGGGYHSVALRANGSISYCTAGTSASGCQATLSTSGAPSATATTGFTLTATSVEGAKNGTIFFGTSGAVAFPWGTGSSYSCVGAPVARAGLLGGTGLPGTCDGMFSQDFNALWAAMPAMAPGAGVRVYVQLWYRDPLSTSNRTTSFSDAIEFTVGP